MYESNDTMETNCLKPIVETQSKTNTGTQRHVLNISNKKIDRLTAYKKCRIRRFIPILTQWKQTNKQTSYISLFFQQHYHIITTKINELEGNKHKQNATVLREKLKTEWIEWKALEIEWIECKTNQIAMLLKRNQMSLMILFRVTVQCCWVVKMFY